MVVVHAHTPSHVRYVGSAALRACLLCYSAQWVHPIDTIIIGLLYLHRINSGYDISELLY
ncbi:hypothetical protein Hanom_Chr07g00622761 [Helianthus anomalus]